MSIINKLLLLLSLLLCTISYTLKADDCHWSIIDTLYYDPNNLGSAMATTYYAIECADSNNCIAYCGMNFTYPWTRVTTDGGKTWFNSLKDTATKDYYPGQPSGFAYPDTSLAIATVYGNYYWISRDKGVTWKKETIPDYNPEYFAFVHFLNKNFGMILAANNDIVITRDGAKTWEIKHFQFPDSLKNAGIGDFFMLDTNTFFFLAGEMEKPSFIVRTMDQCKTWDIMPPDSSLAGNFYFFNKDTGFSAGGIQKSFHSSLYRKIIKKTTDGGKTWVTKHDDGDVPPTFFNNIQFFDTETGIAFNSEGGVYRTTDGGETWLPDKSAEDLRDRSKFPDYPVFYYAINENLIFTVSNDNEIFKYSCGATGVAEEAVQPKTELYPNPAINYFNIKNGNNILPDKIEIYTSLGILISEVNTASSGQIHFGNLPAGMYYLRIYYGNGVESKLLNVAK